MRTIAIVAALLAMPVLVAGAVPPEPVPGLYDFVPPDATGYGAGQGTLVGDDRCPGAIDITLTFTNRTATEGVWLATPEYHMSPATFAAGVCGPILMSPGPLDGFIDPETGGCFGGGEFDGATICFTLVRRDPDTHILSYRTTMELHTDDPPYQYHGYVQAVFSDPLGETP